MITMSINLIEKAISICGVIGGLVAAGVGLWDHDAGFATLGGLLTAFSTLYAFKL